MHKLLGRDEKLRCCGWRTHGNGTEYQSTSVIKEWGGVYFPGAQGNFKNRIPQSVSVENMLISIFEKERHKATVLVFFDVLILKSRKKENANMPIKTKERFLYYRIY